MVGVCGAQNRGVVTGKGPGRKPGLVDARGNIQDVFGGRSRRDATGTDRGDAGRPDRRRPASRLERPGGQVGHPDRVGRPGQFAAIRRSDRVPVSDRHSGRCPAVAGLAALLYTPSGGTGALCARGGPGYGREPGQRLDPAAVAGSDRTTGARTRGSRTPESQVPCPDRNDGRAGRPRPVDAGRNTRAGLARVCAGGRSRFGPLEHASLVRSGGSRPSLGPAIAVPPAPRPGLSLRT